MRTSIASTSWIRSLPVACGLALVLASGASAATIEKTVDVGRASSAVTRRGTYHHRPTPPSGRLYTFAMEVVADELPGGPVRQFHGRPLIHVREGEQYSIRLINPLPCRVGVNLTVDGLNTVTGRPSSLTGGTKWMIEPNSQVTVAGWQVGADAARRFLFTTRGESYASHRSDQVGRDLTTNCGVIGAAFFWSSSELEQALSYADVRVLESEAASGGAFDKSTRFRRNAAPSRGASAPGFDAGTGMGDRIGHSVTSVAFDFDSGMYSAADALLVYYDFARYPAAPLPFSRGEFAPEMPYRR